MPIGKIGSTAGKGADYSAGSVNIDQGKAAGKCTECYVCVCNPSNIEAFFVHYEGAGSI